MARNANPMRHLSLVPPRRREAELPPARRIVLWDELNHRDYPPRPPSPFQAAGLEWTWDGSRERCQSAAARDARRAAGVLFRALEAIDADTAAHSVRVTGMALLFAQHLGLLSRELEALEITCILHDIGKIAIAADVLQKPEPLATEEMALVQRHPEIGQTLLAIMGLEPQQRLVLHHHEHWDGRGYPEGLFGDAIPFLSQVVGLADSYDALTSNRPYRQGCTHWQALAEIEASAGTQFNPELAGEFLEMFHL